MQGSRGPPFSQLPCNPPFAWPNYGGNMGVGVHPMMHMFGNGLYPPFPTGSYHSMSPGYGSYPHNGLADNYVQMPLGHAGRPQQNVDWPNSQNMNTAMYGMSQKLVVPTVFFQKHDPQPMSARPCISSGEPWICPRKKINNIGIPECSTGMNLEVGRSEHVQPCKNIKLKQAMGSSVPSQFRESPIPSLAETEEAPLPSDSVDAEYTVGLNNERHCDDREGKDLFQPVYHLQEDLQDSSKSPTPHYLKQRKARREDVKSYLREVKLAVSEGRVPQVRVVQDENGNLIRYKSQFLNAVKLAAHVIVQDAYINVEDKDMMHEIMEEVRRQFIVPQPLPCGMVESFLKAYFKRCRLQYHQFWMKHGDKKIPDGCKQAIWLELVEYWKSTKGAKECQQNKLNASAQKPCSRKKEKSEGECDVSPHSPHSNEGIGYVRNSSVKSDSLGLSSDSLLKKPSSDFSPVATRHPMADISNQLHEAVDNILLSFAGKCYSLPPSKEKSADTITRFEGSGSQSVKSNRVGFRTPAEVLGSLQRPKATEYEGNIGVSQPPSFEGRRRSVEISIAEGNMKSKMSSRSPKEFMVARNEAVELSSGSSSDGTKITGMKEVEERRSENIVKNLSRVYTEEIEPMPRLPADSASADNLKGKKPLCGAGIIMQGTPKRVAYMAPLKHNFIIENKSSVDRGQGKHVEKVMSSTRTQKLSKKAAVEVDSDNDRRSDKERSEDRDSNLHFDCESEEEEPPVLPREIVKRKVDVENNGIARKKEVTGRATTRSNKTPLKKHKGTEIDGSVLRNLEFYKRPKKSHPIKTRTRVWVLHPNYVGKVVAEATAGVNRKSRCVDSANEICKEGRQLISVLRVLYKNMPVMFDKDSHFPKQISYLDQAEGLANTPILWCISHLIEIPPVHQITKLIGEILQPLSQEKTQSDSDFEDRGLKRNSKCSTISLKDSKRGHLPNASTALSQGLRGSKGSRNVLRSSNP